MQEEWMGESKRKWNRFHFQRRKKRIFTMIENDKFMIGDEKWLDNNCTKSESELRQYSQKSIAHWVAA